MTYKKGMNLPQAIALTEKFTQELNKIGITHTQVAGSIRRKELSIGDIDIIVEGDLEKVKTIPGVEFKNGGDTRLTLVYDGQQINVFRAELEYWGSMLFSLTSPTGSQIHYRAKAKSMNMVFNQYGLWKDGKCIASKTEQDIYAAFGKPYKEPERRGK